MLEKIFGRKKKKPEVFPDIKFGRYSDNNKSLEQIKRWKEAENLFSEKKIFESFDAFFEYLKDAEADNVLHERNESGGSFSLYQGSKILKGKYNDKNLEAEVSLAHMATPSTPVMRRLLEQNFHIYYTRYALDKERLCMLFDTRIDNASPGKLYYGLKELATRADKQDDLLVHDFTVLEMTETEHIVPLPEKEKEIKFHYFQKWVNELLELVEPLDKEKFSGGIAYLILSLFFRINYAASISSSSSLLVNERLNCKRLSYLILSLFILIRGYFGCQFFSISSIRSSIASLLNLFSAGS